METQSTASRYEPATKQLPIQVTQGRTQRLEPSLSPSPSQSSSSSDSKIQELLQKYPFATEPSYFTRPNRYNGPASTWRLWTANDRSIADAVERERAEDLSVHLFNAFALRKRSQLYQRRSSSNLVSGSRDGSSRVDTDAINNDETGVQQAFVPPRLWTAWPLRGWEVPRCNQNASRTGSTGHNWRQDKSRSEDLEEMLMAITLRHAKERWDTREVEVEIEPPPIKKRDWNVERELTRQQLIDSGVIKRAESIDPEIDIPNAVGTPAVSQNLHEHDSLESDVEVLPSDVQMFSSQAFLVESSSSEDSDGQEAKTENSDNHPIFSADDEEARKILMSSTRHVLSKLDDLLVGLQKARRAYAEKEWKRRASSVSAPEMTSMSRSRARSIKAQSDIAITDQSGKEDGEDQYVRSGTRRSSTKNLRRKRERGRKRQRSPSSSKAAQSRPTQYNLRDWSDIIGMATLTGWKTETVLRAAERCAKLFDENMMFRTFHDPMSVDSSEGLQQGTASFDEEFAYVPSQHGNDEHEDNDRRAGLTSIAATTKDFVDRSRLLNPRVCPHPTCPRHTHPFKKRYHLERHLHDVHREENREASPTTFRMSRGSASDLEAMITTDLKCPVQTCERHWHEYSRPARLYAHIRRVHPEIDLLKFKGLLGQSSQSWRGKYDRRISRSRSRNKSVGSSVNTSEDEDENDVVEEDMMVEDQDDDNNEEERDGEEDDVQDEANARRNVVKVVDYNDNGDAMENSSAEEEP